MVVEPEQSLSHNDNADSDNETKAWAERWLSAERLAPYLADCGGDIKQALSLYEWNISLGQVLMRDIAHFEVALRNAYDCALRDYWDCGAHWLLDDGSPVRRPIMRKSARGEFDANRISRKAIDTAVGRLVGNTTPAAIISNLTLGFWVHLSDRPREAVIWRPALYRAWPRGTNRCELQSRLNVILHVRNRVAHVECLFDPSESKLSPLAADAYAVELLHVLCPEAAERLYGCDVRTPIEVFCEEHPTPVNVRL